VLDVVEDMAKRRVVIAVDDDDDSAVVVLEENANAAADATAKNDFCRCRIANGTLETIGLVFWFFGFVSVLFL